MGNEIPCNKYYTVIQYTLVNKGTRHWAKTLGNYCLARARKILIIVLKWEIEKCCPKIFYCYIFAPWWRYLILIMLMPVSRWCSDSFQLPSLLDSFAAVAIVFLFEAFTQIKSSCGSCLNPDWVLLLLLLLTMSPFQGIWSQGEY